MGCETLTPDLLLIPEAPSAGHAQCICEWADREAVFARLEAEVRRELAAGRLPPVQPFHAMAYPFPADLALAVSIKCAPWTLFQDLGRVPRPGLDLALALESWPSPAHAVVGFEGHPRL